MAADDLLCTVLKFGGLGSARLPFGYLAKQKTQFFGNRMTRRKMDRNYGHKKMSYGLTVVRGICNASFVEELLRTYSIR